MRKKLLLIIFLFPTYLFAQSDLFKPQTEMIGTTIKELTITDYLQNKPADTNYNNKFKVLEFWATWCKPCLKAVPHLNKLQNKFKNKNIVFLSFTNQKPEETIKTLEKVKFETIVVSDQTRKTQRDLKIENNGILPIPRTVLIDDENKIVWYGSPQKLTEKLIEKFLKKEKLTD
jgi:thiol-disulfide isomerase/thioredoxin